MFGQEGLCGLTQPVETESAFLGCGVSVNWDLDDGCSTVLLKNLKQIVKSEVTTIYFQKPHFMSYTFKNFYKCKTT